MYSRGSGTAGRLRTDLQLCIYVQDFVFLRCPCYLCCPGLNADLGTYPLQTEQLSQLPCWAPGGRRSRGGAGSAGTGEQILPALPQHSSCSSPLGCVSLLGAQQLLTAFPESCWRRAQGRAGCSPAPLGEGRQQELGMCWRGFRAAAP